MRETVGTENLFKAMIAFTLLFAAFLSLAVVYNKAFKLKNESISIIEEYEGVTPKSLGIINNYLKNSNYDNKGYCQDGEYGQVSFENTNLELAESGTKYYYCLKEICTEGNCNTINNKNKIYYQLRIFFNFNLPIFGDLFTFDIKGETKKINYYSDIQRLEG